MGSSSPLPQRLLLLLSVSAGACSYPRPRRTRPDRAGPQ
jgi:hypothetical protein